MADQTDIVEKKASGKLQEIGLQSSAGLNYNKYVTQKTIAAGALNIAVMTNSVSLLKTIVLKEGAKEQPLYYAVLFILPMLILLETTMAILSVLLAFANMDDEKVRARANKMNYAFLIITIITTVLNIFAVQFGQDFLEEDEPTEQAATGNMIY